MGKKAQPVMTAEERSLKGSEKLLKACKDDDVKKCEEAVKHWGADVQPWLSSEFNGKYTEVPSLR